MDTSSRTEDETIQIGDTIINLSGTQYKILKLSEPEIEGDYRIYDKTEIKITTPSGEDFTVENVLQIGVNLRKYNDVLTIYGLYIAPRVHFEELRKIHTSTTFGKLRAFMGSSDYINNGDEIVDRDGNNIKIIKVPPSSTESRAGYRIYDKIHIKITKPSGEVFEDDTLFELIDIEIPNASGVEHILKIYPRIKLLQYSIYKNSNTYIDVTNSVAGPRIYTFYIKKYDKDILLPTLLKPSSTSTKTFIELFSDFYDASTMYKVESYLLTVAGYGKSASSETFKEYLQSIINAELMANRPIVYKIKHKETGEVNIYLLLEADKDGYMYYSADGSSFKEDKLSLHEMITRWNSMKYFYYVYRCPYEKYALKGYFLYGSGASASNSSASNSSSAAKPTSVVNPLAAVKPSPTTASNSSSAAKPTSAVNPLAAVKPSPTTASNSSSAAKPTSVVNPLAVAVKPSTPTSATATSVVNPLAVAASSAGAEPPKPCKKGSSCSVQGGSRKNRRKSRRHKSKKQCGRSRKTLRKTH